MRTQCGLKSNFSKKQQKSIPTKTGKRVSD